MVRKKVSLSIGSDSQLSKKAIRCTLSREQQSQDQLKSNWIKGEMQLNLSVGQFLLLELGWLMSISLLIARRHS